MGESGINKVEMDCLAEALDLLDKHEVIAITLSKQTLEDKGFEGLFDLLSKSNKEEGNHDI